MALRQGHPQLSLETGVCGQEEVGLETGVCGQEALD